MTSSAFSSRVSGWIRRYPVLSLATVVAAFMPPQAMAEEVEELKVLIREMEQRHRREMADLRAQIERLAPKETPPASHNDSGSKAEKLERELRQGSKGEAMTAVSSGFISPNDWQFDLGGELEFEFVQTENGTGVAEPDAHFQIDQLYLYPKVRYKDYALFSADIDITGTDGFIEEAWTRFFGLPFNTWVEVGLNDMFIANIARKSESEILIETAFYRDDDMGATIGGEPLHWLYWKVSATNGLALATKEPSEDKSFPLIHDNRNLSNANDQLMLAAGLGLKFDLGALGRFDVLPYYYNGRLSDADITFLQALPGYGTSTDDDKTRYGFNFRYDMAELTLIAQLLEATDGTLDRTGWFIQPSHRFQLSGRDWFNAVELFYRYNDLTVDVPNVAGNSLTWDRQQHVFALLLDIFRRTRIKLEYYVNDEDTGGADVANDEFLTQIEVKW